MGRQARVPARVDDLVGGVLALGILAAWGASLVACLSRPASGPWVVPLVALRTFLCTGLFIVAHDAIHGSLVHNARLGHAFGRVALLLYACMPYARVRRLHHLHHAHPGVAGLDPDYANRDGAGPVRWYLQFMGRYLRAPQLLGMAMLFTLGHVGLGLGAERLFVWWALPPVLSTVQLFVVGTWLPHHPPHAAGDPHRARSLRLSRALHLLACYNFGDHRRHHARPELPWWRLGAPADG